MPPAPAAPAGGRQGAAAAEEEAAIGVRLLTHAASTVKGRAPLFKAVAQSFLAVAEAAQNGSLEATLAAQRAFTLEMDSLELQLARFEAANDASERERLGYAEKQQQLEGQIRQALEDIDHKKRELAAARVVRQQKEEYEVIRGLIAAQPARAATQAAIDEERAAIASLKAEQARLEASLASKRRAFALLMQCLDELQRAGEAEAGADGGGGAGGGGGPAAMQVDG